MAEFYGVQSLPDEAIRASQSALEIAQQLGNNSQLIANINALAAKYGDLGNWEQSLHYQQEAGKVISQKPTGHQQHWATYIQTARQLYGSLGMPAQAPNILYSSMSENG